MPNDEPVRRGYEAPKQEERTEDPGDCLTRARSTSARKREAPPCSTRRERDGEQGGAVPDAIGELGSAVGERTSVSEGGWNVGGRGQRPVLYSHSSWEIPHLAGTSVSDPVQRLSTNEFPGRSVSTAVVAPRPAAAGQLNSPLKRFPSMLTARFSR